MNVKQLNSYSLGCFAFLLAAPPALASLGLGLFVIGSLYNYFRERPKIRWGLGWPYLILFGIYLVGSLYSPDQSYAFHILGKIMAFLIIPLCFLLNGALFSNKLRDSIRFFVLGVLFWNVVSIAIALFYYIDSKNFAVFTYYNLAEILHLHPTYQSLYILTALVLLPIVQFHNTVLRAAIFLFLIIVLLLLEARIAVFIGIFIAAYNLVALYKINKSVTFLTFAIILFGAVLFLNSSKRIDDIHSSNYTNKVVGTINENGINQRFWLWKNAWNQYLDKPIFGYGLGAQKSVFHYKVHKDLLFESYDHQYTIAAKKLSKLNLHNQYLQILFEFGLVGLVLFLCVIFYFLRIFYKKRMFLGIAIILIFCVVLLTENLIDRQMGIYYFIFFSSLFLFAEPLEPKCTETIIPTTKI